MKQDVINKEHDFNAPSIQAAKDSVTLEILLVHLKIKDVCLSFFFFFGGGGGGGLNPPSKGIQC